MYAQLDANWRGEKALKSSPDKKDDDEGARRTAVARGGGGGARYVAVMILTDLRYDREDGKEL